MPGTSYADHPAVIPSSSKWRPEYAHEEALARRPRPNAEARRLLGRWHQPEFTLLEWYRVGWDEHVAMMGIDVDVGNSANAVAYPAPRFGMGGASHADFTGTLWPNRIRRSTSIDRHR